jgi:hypothetical protein
MMGSRLALQQCVIARPVPASDAAQAQSDLEVRKTTGSTVLLSLCAGYASDFSRYLKISV